MCVLPTALPPLHDCTSGEPSVKPLRFADNTTVIGLIRDCDESVYRWKVEQLVLWCGQNNLELNNLKTVEMMLDFKRNPPTLPPHHPQQHCVCCGDLQVSVIHNLPGPKAKVGLQHRHLHQKAQLRMNFLCQLRKFNLPQGLLIQFYTAIIQSVLCTSITVWFGSATKQDRRRQSGPQKNLWCQPALHPAPVKP